MSTALGGGRGVLEAAVPTAAFTLAWIVSQHLTLSLGIAVGAALVLLVLRLLRRETPRFVLNSLAGIAIAAFFALRSGRAEDAFLPGILYNAGYTVVLVGSVLVRWPVVGFLLGSVSGDPVEWHRSREVVRLASRLTLLLAVPCALRVLVQYPLWLAGETAWLGVAKLVLGWPLQVAAIAAALALLTRGSTPLPQPAAAERAASEE
ncbi:MAG: DUF3159 domain-containing protein [Actinomycetales bacterium]